MTLWGMVLFWALVGLAAGQALAAIKFIRTLRRARHASTPAGPCPKTAVILCLRGSDPFLTACLEAILHQDYPCYDLRIVIDSPEDPAWKIAEQVATRCGAANVQIRALTSRRPTCSLKCSSLVQAVSELDASYEVIALLDADTVPHRTWLRELVAPLADERVAAATGNRWYMPESASWGSLVRRLWNAAAVVQMYAYRIPWGGTLALKASVLRGSDLLDRWAHAFCEDTMLYSVLRRSGHRVAFVPSLMMVNREDCSVGSFYRWVRRQLLTARLYHPAWAMVVGHGLLVSLAQWIGVVSLIVALAAGYGLAAAWLLAGMGLYWGTMAGLLAAMEAGIRRMLAARGELYGRVSNPLQVSSLLRVGAAMLLTQAVYPAALLSALFLRTVEWRGVRYRIQGPRGIRMVEYERHAAGGEVKQTFQSL